MRPDWTIIFKFFHLFGISKTHPEDLKKGQRLHCGIVLYSYDKDYKHYVAREAKRWLV